MRYNIINVLIGISLLAAMTTAQAITRLPGTDVYYKVDKDAMTDENQSIVIVSEVNDTAGNTGVYFRCRGSGGYEVFLRTKNALLTEANYDAEKFPNVMYRVDKQTAKTIPSEGVVSGDQREYTVLTFSDSNARALHQAFVAANKLAIRILRDGLSPLDYTFNARGFIAGMKAVNNCR